MPTDANILSKAIRSAPTGAGWLPVEAQGFKRIREDVLVGLTPIATPLDPVPKTVAARLDTLSEAIPIPYSALPARGSSDGAGLVAVDASGLKKTTEAALVGATPIGTTADPAPKTVATRLDALTAALPVPYSSLPSRGASDGTGLVAVDASGLTKTTEAALVGTTPIGTSADPTPKTVASRLDTLAASTTRVAVNRGIDSVVDGTTPVIDFALNNVLTWTLGASRTAPAPSGLVAGATYILIVKQGTGGQLVTWNPIWVFPAGVPPVLQTAAGAVDIITGIYDGSVLRVAAGEGWLS